MRPTRPIYYRIIRQRSPPNPLERDPPSILLPWRFLHTSTQPLVTLQQKSLSVAGLAGWSVNSVGRDDTCTSAAAVPASSTAPCSMEGRKKSEVPSQPIWSINSHPLRSASFLMLPSLMFSYPNSTYLMSHLPSVSYHTQSQYGDILCTVLEGFVNI